LSKDKVHDVSKSIYEEEYSGSKMIVLYFCKLIRSPDSSQEAGVRESHPAKVLKVYHKLLKFRKASDQGRAPRLVPEQNEESNAKIKNRQGTPLENKGMWLFTLFFLKSSYTMPNRYNN
jgi:hypothetical protein